MPLKVMTIVGTRPEVIKLSRVITQLDEHVDHVLVHTGQNFDYELNQIFFDDLNVRRPDHFLNVAGDTLAQTLAHVITRADEVFEREQPDALLMLGDTNSCLAAIPAKRRKIPIFHMEAGNRCFDLRVPEEINRKIVDHLSDINLTYTEHARRYLLDEGLRPETVIKTGSPMTEVLEHYKAQIGSANVLERLQLVQNKYFLVSIHREENVDSHEHLVRLLESLNQIAAGYAHPVVVSTHPRTRARITELGEFDFDSRLRFLKPLGFFDYVHLQKHAFCVLSDSGTITEEASILNFPAVMIRQAHERPEGMDEATVVMSGLRPERVMDAIKLVTRHAAEFDRPAKVVSDYLPDNVSRKVVRIITSYTDYVNRTVWHVR